MLIQRILSSLKRFSKRISSDHFFLGIFFGFLTIGLFLGDGKQPLIDTLASVVIISMYIYAKYFLKKQRDLPVYLTSLWTVNIVYFVARSILSDSVGYSITTTMRFIMAYLVYAIFYEFSQRDYLQYFIKFLILFSFFAIAVSYVLILIPQLTLLMPLMNLLYANYGHNNISTLLLFIYPTLLISILRVSNKTNKKSYLFLLVLYFLVSLTIILSFSRGVILLTGLYTIFQIGISNPKRLNRRIIILGVFGLFACLSFIFFSILSVQTKHLDKVPVWLQRQIDKPLLMQEGRLGYWNQALRATKLNPLFGTGPGTFYVLSKRFQSNPNNYSWFAHNFILQLIAENGLVGLLLFSGLLISIVISGLKNLSIFSSYIILGVGLIFINSLFDFSFDFLIIWILTWTALSLFSVPYRKDFS